MKNPPDACSLKGKFIAKNCVNGGPVIERSRVIRQEELHLFVKVTLYDLSTKRFNNLKIQQ